MESLDATDLALLDHLQRDASVSNLDLAARVHVSPPTCLRRVKRLRDVGLIEREIVRRKVISGVGVAKWLAATGVISVADFHLIEGFFKTIF